MGSSGINESTWGTQNDEPTSVCRLRHGARVPFWSAVSGVRDMPYNQPAHGISGALRSVPHRPGVSHRGSCCRVWSVQYGASDATSGSDIIDTAGLSARDTAPEA